MHEYEFDPDKAYFGNWLWLPKSRINEEGIKRNLVIDTDKRYMQLWDECETHVAVPRRYFQEDEISLEICDIRPKNYPKASLVSNIELWPKQKVAFNNIVDRDGILNQSCGSGKTVLLLYLAAHYNVPTLIVNDKIHILNQWKGEILDKLDIEEKQIGKIQGKPNKWKWENKDIVLASLKTLESYRNEIPEELPNYFGLGIWDEVHHMGAPTYLLTAHILPGRRIGATATAYRSDGAEKAYFGHIGPIIHKDLHQELTPECIVMPSSTRVVNVYDTTDIYGEIHHKKLAAHIGTQEEELEFLKSVVEYGVKKGRNILAITASKDQAILMNEMCPNSCVMHADIPPDQRLKDFNNYNLTFATSDQAVEALNKKGLDTLVAMSEFSNHNWLQQSVGRVQRYKPEKKRPKVLVIKHINVPYMARQANRMVKYFESNGFKVRHI